MVTEQERAGDKGAVSKTDGWQPFTHTHKKGKTCVYLGLFILNTATVDCCRFAVTATHTDMKGKAEAG